MLVYTTFEVFNAGTPVTGQAGSFTVTECKALSTGAAVTPLPTIIEYANGIYGFALDPEVVGDDVVVQIDITATYGTGATRYLMFPVRLRDSRTRTALVASGALLDLAQVIPASNTAQTVGDALNAARAQGFGAWSISGTSLILYAADGVTVVRTFTLNSASNPSARA